MKRLPYPLQWPEGWKRTVNRHGRGTASYQAKFDTNFVRDRDAVIRQLKRRGSNIIITSDLPIGAGGLPYIAHRSADPGIAVYWVEKGHEQVIACDRWRTHELNMRAIDMSLEALRGLDRWGASEMVDRAFAGFAALPPGSSGSMPTGPRPWRDVIGGEWPPLDKVELLAIAKARYRRLIADAHPDAGDGGDVDRAAELNVAIAAAEAELAR